LAAKFFFSLRFFLLNTTARWFYRAIDDSIINFEKLGTFLQNLERKKNPLQDWVFLGNCVRNDPWAFPQGGSGVLISRAAVRVLEPLCRQFIGTMMQPEDVAFQPFLESLNVSMWSITSPNFCGHRFEDDDLGKMRRGAWQELKDCPPKEGRSGEKCRPFLSPISDIVFYHEWMGEFFSIFDNAKAVFATDRRVTWYTNEMHLRVCKVPG
jgi:hypothetical protein